MFLRTTPRYSSKALNSNGFPRMDAASSEATHYQYSTARIFELITPGHGRAGATRLGRLAGLAVAKYLRRASSNFSSQISGQLFGGRVVLRRPASCTKMLCPIGGRDEVRVPRVAISGTGSEAIHDHQLSFMLHYWPVQCAPRFGDALRGST